MKKKLVFILLGLLVVLGGCATTERYTDFSKTDQSLVFSGQRKRSFGDSDYSTIKTEKEAYKLLIDKYNVTIPTYYNQTKHLLEKRLTSSKVRMGEADYSVYARNKELEFRTLYCFYDGSELQAFSEVVLTYAYLADYEQAYLKSQLVTIKVVPAKGKLPNDNIHEIIHDLGKNMKLSETKVDQGLLQYDKRVKKRNAPITDDYLPIVTNANELEKSKELLKEIAVSYDQDGTLREIYAEISDQQ